MAQQSPILAVDDEPINLLVITAMLQQMGYECVSAKDGDEAVKMAAGDPPSLILMDISMPRLNGFDAAKCIWRDRPDAHIPIVAVTANVTRRQREECETAGFDGFLAKPLDESELRSIVEKLSAVA